MAKTTIHHGPHDSIPPDASPGLLFIRKFMSIVDSLDGDPGRLSEILANDSKFIFNGGEPQPAEGVVSALRMRSGKLRSYRHDQDVAWDIDHGDGTRTVMSESTCVVAFKEDPEGVEAKVREFSVIELVSLTDGGVVKARELRSFMDPSPTGPDRR